ncbi:MAG: hypothetical protein JNK72_11600 [Myxococcales bacterium]|nr:hypothetical protein [Myxococcales bacterium]
MMSPRRLSGMLALALSLPAVSMAQDGRATVQTRGEGAARSVEYRFGDEIVSSSLLRPTEARSTARRPHAGPTLVRHRAHFVPELLHAVEQL